MDTEIASIYENTNIDGTASLIFESSNIELSGNILFSNYSNTDISFNQNLHIEKKLARLNNNFIQRGQILSGKQEMEDIHNPIDGSKPVPYNSSHADEYLFLDTYLMVYGWIVKLNHDGTRLAVASDRWLRIHNGPTNPVNDWPEGTYNKQFGNIFTYSYNNGKWEKDCSNIHIDNSNIITVGGGFGNTMAIDNCFNFLIGGDDGKCTQIVFTYNQNKWLQYYGMHNLDDYEVGKSFAVSDNNIMVSLDFRASGGNVYLKNLNNSISTFSLPLSDNKRIADGQGNASSGEYMENDNAIERQELIKYLDHNSIKRKLVYGKLHDGTAVGIDVEATNVQNISNNNIQARGSQGFKFGNDDSVTISANGSRIAMAILAYQADIGIIITVDISGDANETSGYIAKDARFIFHGEGVLSQIDTSKNDNITFLTTGLYQTGKGGMAFSNDGNRLVAGSYDYNSARGVVTIHDYSYNILNWVTTGKLELEQNSDSVNERFGYRISLSGDGKRLAVATAGQNISTNDNVPRVFIYDYINNEWILNFPILYLEMQQEINSIHLSKNGKVLAIGMPRTPDPGCVKVYELVENIELNFTNIVFAIIDKYDFNSVNNNYIDISNYYFD